VQRTIHQLWIGSPLPDHLRALTDTWREHHPHWHYRLWTETDIAGLNMPYRDLYDQAEQIVPADAVWQFRSDLARFVILRDHGGLWADTDTRAQRPVDDLLTAPMVIGWEIQDRWIGTSTIYAEAGHPALDEVIERIDTLTRQAKPGTRPNRLTGPKAISDLLRHRRDVRILPERLWYPVRWDDPLAADEHQDGAYVSHLWQHQRDLRALGECRSPA